MIIYAAVLDFGEEFARDKTPEEFVGTVNSYLRLHDRKIIERFRLFFYPENQYLSDFENWIEFSIAKGVKELDLDGCHHYLPFIMIPGEPIQDKKPFKVPNCIFTSNSLTQLNLARCDFNLPLNFSGLCSLKTLYLRWVHITDEMLERTILNCPFLEKLTLRECKDLSSIKISSPDLQLKSLTLVDCYATYLEMLAPNLQSFHFNGDFCDYSLSNISSLVDAIFTAVNWDNVYDFEYDRTTLWSKFSHIKILTICRNALPFLDDFDGLEADIFQQGMPLTFHNLQELQLLLDGVGDGDLASLFTFFKECSFPCLQVLFIQLQTHPCDSKDQWEMNMEYPSECIFGHLKTIKMNSFLGRNHEMQLVKFFLEKAIVLESMVLVTPRKDINVALKKRYSATSQTPSEELQLEHIQDQLLLLPKASFDAEIVLCEDGEDNNSLRPTHTEFCDWIY